MQKVGEMFSISHSFYGVAKAIEEGRANGKMGQLW